MKTIVIGLGNPILGDDGVGWKVAQEVQRVVETDARYFMPIRPLGTKTVQHVSPIEVDCVALGGLSLMERMVGYQRAILVDSMETGQNPIGSVKVFALEELPNPSASHSTAAHDTSLLTALEVGRKMKLNVPDSVTVVAIEAKNVYDFSEELSPAVAEAVPVAYEAVMNLLKSPEGVI
ncbi:MAG: hydrogenase maturation protease [Chloroflexi bacterium]|nr:hydrogenase maturation protease [Chloroflexota bacterium]